LLFFLVGALFCAATLHVPRRLGPAPMGAATVSVIARDKANLTAWWLRPAEQNGTCVLILHGVGDSRVGSAGFAPMFLNEGYSVLLPDSRAHGASGGEFVTYGLMEKYDTLIWAEWMRGAGCVKLYALGESLGASVLIEAAALQPAFSAIVAESPFADLPGVARYRVQHLSGLPGAAASVVVSSAVFYARWIDGLRLDQVSPVRDIARASTPILLIHGLEDFRTPASNSEELAKANPRDALWLVPNAEHTGAAWAQPEEFRRRVLGWFAEH
jgi:dipeptidyl aminopeptidase/acylaminoacyl peptidase